MARLPSSWQLPEPIKNRFGQKGAGKQRAMTAEDHLLLVLHKSPRPDHAIGDTVFFWRNPEGEWKYSSKGQGLKMLFTHLEEYDLAQNKLLKNYHECQNSEDYFQLLEKILPLQIATKNLHLTLQSAREMIVEDKDLIDLRDWACEIERDLELLYINAKNALDFQMAKKAEEQAELSLKSVKAGDRLNLLAAIFFPLTAIASVFGMNLPSGLENASILLFWIVFIIGLGLGLMIRSWIFQGMKPQIHKKLPRRTESS
jgi:hypothetical protein